jgi:hypothetical protein
MLENDKLVKEIQALGYKVHVRHYRRMMDSESCFDMNTIKQAGLQDWIDAYGGYSECTVFWEGDNPCFTVTAKCSSKDRFNKKLGAHIALARALKRITEPEIKGSLGAWIKFPMPLGNSGTISNGDNIQWSYNVTYNEGD